MYTYTYYPSLNPTKALLQFSGQESWVPFRLRPRRPAEGPSRAPLSVARARLGESSAPFGRSPDKGRNKRNFPKKTLRREAAAGAAGPPVGLARDSKAPIPPSARGPGQRAPQHSAPGGSALSTDASGRPPWALGRQGPRPPREPPLAQGRDATERPHPTGCRTPPPSAATRALLSRWDQPLPYLARRAAVTWGWRVRARTPASPTRASGRLLNLQVTQWGERACALGLPGGGRGEAGRRWGVLGGDGGVGPVPKGRKREVEKQSPFWSRPDGQPPRGS